MNIDGEQKLGSLIENPLESVARKVFGTHKIIYKAWKSIRT